MQCDQIMIYLILIVYINFILKFLRLQIYVYSYYSDFQDDRNIGLMLIWKLHVNIIY